MDLLGGHCGMRSYRWDTHRGQWTQPKTAQRAFSTQGERVRRTISIQQ